MKLMIASDIHGSAYYCKKIVEAFHSEKADKLLLLGDILYHGPRNALPKDYSPKDVAIMLNEMNDKILSVEKNKQIILNEYAKFRKEYTKLAKKSIKDIKELFNLR